MDASMTNPLHGIAHLLIESDLLSNEKLTFYQDLAYKNGINLLNYLVCNQIICPTLVATLIAEHFKMPLIDLDSIDIASIPSNLINDKLIKCYRMVPLFHERTQLSIATDDPSQHEALQALQFHTGLHVSAVLVESHKLTKLINQLLNQNENQDLMNLVGTSNSNTETEDVSCEDEPVVKFVKRIILDAIEQGASDIHFEPYEQAYRIRYRQDGVLNVIATPPYSLSSRLAARLKIMANLDISEKRVPQDGRFTISSSTMQAIDFRISTCPTVSGEKIVLRILDTKTMQPNIEALGFLPQQKALFSKAIERPQGLILITGPTGCGKTMTLYSALHLLNTGEKNILSVEDPVEMNVHGINQVHINPKAGLTFANVLRAFLRQDPDVMMIGEIRDVETAEIAIKAAQTGHLVLSTLHTNSATETLTRLINMGIPAFNVASSISLIIAQRLVRRLCNACKIINNTELLFPSYKSQGCNQCIGGYRGRIALFEVLPISKSIAQMITSGIHAHDLLNQAQTEGMYTLAEAGLEQVKLGITSLDEVNRMIYD